MLVRVKWNKATEQWRIRTLNDEALQEVFDCSTAQFLTQDLNKQEEYTAKINISFFK